MPKLRKMLTDVDAPYIRSLMRLVETQSTATIAAWCTDYSEAHLLPLWRQAFPDDARPKAALNAAREFLAGSLKLPDAKKQIMECRAAARAAEGAPVAQGAARAIDASASSIHNPAGALGLAFYGALALAYNQAGTTAPWPVLEPLAAAECAKMEAALRAVANPNEPNPAKINWGC